MTHHSCTRKCDDSLETRTFKRKTPFKRHMLNFSFRPENDTADDIVNSRTKSHTRRKFYPPDLTRDNDDPTRGWGIGSGLSAVTGVPECPYSDDKNDIGHGLLSCSDRCVACILCRPQQIGKAKKWWMAMKKVIAMINWPLSMWTREQCEPGAVANARLIDHCSGTRRGCRHGSCHVTENDVRPMHGSLKQDRITTTSHVSSTGARV